MYVSLNLFCWYCTGVKIDGVKERTIKGILLDTTMDSPARSAWLNIKQHNGYNGCSTCTEPGEQLDLGPGSKMPDGNVTFIPFIKNLHKLQAMLNIELIMWSSKRLFLPCLNFLREDRFL